MFNPLIHPIFAFICINWFLIFTPFLSFFSFLSSLIWSFFLSFLLLYNHPFLDGYYFGSILAIDTYNIMVLMILTIFLIVYLFSFFNSNLKNSKEFPLLLLIIYFGFTSFLFSNDFILLYLSIELFSLTFYLITTIHQNYFTTEAGIKYFIYNFIAGGFYLLGCTLIYMNEGTINFIQLIELNPFMGKEAWPFLFIIISFLFKLSIAPFHFWTPDIYQGVLYPITGFFTIFPKFLIIGLFVKLYMYVMYVPFFNYLFFILGLLSVFVGTFNAFKQINLKRLLAYSTISNAGYLLILIALGSPLSIEYLYIFIFTYILANIGIFTILIHLNVSNLLQFKSLFNNNKLYGFFFTLPILSLAGLPPLLGFIGKYITIYVISASGLEFIAGILLVLSIISLFYYLRIVHYLFFYSGETPQSNDESKPLNSALTSFPDFSQAFVVLLVNMSLIFFTFNPSIIIILAKILSLSLTLN
jgi:NADH-quinone oxidoreductase subunit N